jgi:hypothetical protein
VRRGLVWTLVIIAGVIVVALVTAAIGTRDKSGETVPAAEWAQSVCGVAATWRGQMEDIVDQIRTPPAVGSLGIEEPQSETPQGRRELIRGGLETAVQATDSLVDGIENAGVPDTPQGSAAAQQVSEWADSSHDDLEQAKALLRKEAETLEDAVGQLRGAAAALAKTLADGVKTFASIGRLDPQLAAALRGSSTCRELHEEEAST